MELVEIKNIHNRIYYINIDKIESISKYNNNNVGEASYNITMHSGNKIENIPKVEIDIIFNHIKAIKRNSIIEEIIK